MDTLLQMITTLSAGLFAGAAIYINIVEHRARTGCGTDIAVTEFGASYKIGAMFMGTLLTTGFLSATAAWLMGASGWWLIGGCVLLSLIPYTMLFVFPINKRLLDSSLLKDSDLATNLLSRWGRLHAIRSLAGLASFLIFTFLLINGASN
jgi:hypothetical protein